MANLTVSIADILWVAASIVTIAAAWGVLKKNPITRVEKKIDDVQKNTDEKFEDIEERFKLTDEKLARDLVRLESSDATDRILCKCMLVLIDHEITGNGIEKMKTIRSELQQYLINK